MLTGRLHYSAVKDLLPKAVRPGETETQRAKLETERDRDSWERSGNVQAERTGPENKAEGETGTQHPRQVVLRREVAQTQTDRGRRLR